jgi:hypothetical protein
LSLFDGNISDEEKNNFFKLTIRVNCIKSFFVTVKEAEKAMVFVLVKLASLFRLYEYVRERLGAYSRGLGLDKLRPC